MGFAPRDWIRGRLPPLEFPDSEQETRYQQARDAWLRLRVLPVALLIAAVFLAFILFDWFAAPGSFGVLVAVRVATALLLAGIGLLARYRPGTMSIRLATCLLASIVYAGVLMTRVVVGVESDYQFNEAFMLIQVGVWFFGGVTFLVAAQVNVVAILVYIAIEFFSVGATATEVSQSILYLGALYVVSGFAAYNIERQFRANFAANEELAEQKRNYRSRAMRDGLTGLWNRQAMEERLVAACASCLPGAVFVVDLDGFKPVNDRHGHHAGDEVLVAVARRIQSVVRPGDAVGRIGGDEFLVLAEDLADASRAAQLAERIRDRVQAPIRVRLHGDSSTVEVQVGASVGYCPYAGTAVAPASIIRTADAAMYEDKDRRKRGSLDVG